LLRRQLLGQEGLLICLLVKASQGFAEKELDKINLKVNI